MPLTSTPPIKLMAIGGAYGKRADGSVHLTDYYRGGDKVVDYQFINPYWGNYGTYGYQNRNYARNHIFFTLEGQEYHGYKWYWAGALVYDDPVVAGPANRFQVIEVVRNGTTYNYKGGYIPAWPGSTDEIPFGGITVYNTWAQIERRQLIEEGWQPRNQNVPYSGDLSMLDFLNGSNYYSQT